MDSYTNAGIYQTKGATYYEGFVVVLSAFANEESVMAIPLYNKDQGAGVPILVDSTLMYIGTCSMFRLRNNEISSKIAVLDAYGIESVIKSLSQAVNGEIQNVLIPSAILTSDYQNEVNVAGNDAIAPKKAFKRNRYTLEDYKYILMNYPANISNIVSKYDLSDKHSAYRLKDYLQRRFKKAFEERNSGASMGERQYGEGE